MIFLEYLCEQLYGEPYRQANGMSHWPCPRCESSTFHTMPPKSGCKDRAKCHRCNWLADEYDLLIDHGVTDFGERRMRIEQFKKEYVKAVPLTVRTTKGCYLDTAGPSPRGETRSPNVYDRNPSDDAGSDECDKAIKLLRAYLEGATVDGQAALQVLAGIFNALEICAAFGLHPQGLAARIAFVIDGMKSNASQRPNRSRY
jgi:hypothetical protein